MASVLACTTLACTALACGRAERPPERATPRDRAATTTAPMPAPRPRVALDGAGIVLVDPATGSTRAVSFGTSEGEAVQAVAAALGPSRARNTNEECGAGPLDFLAFDGGLTLNVQAGRFVGWAVQPTSGSGLRTMSGIGLGSTRAELTAAYTATIAPTTIGIEFMAGGLQGVLASNATTARITDLWAGTNCVMR